MTVITWLLLCELIACNIIAHFCNTHINDLKMSLCAHFVLLEIQWLMCPQCNKSKRNDMKTNEGSGRLALSVCGEPCSPPQPRSNIQITSKHFLSQQPRWSFMCNQWPLTSGTQQEGSLFTAPRSQHMLLKWKLVKSGVIWGNPPEKPVFSWFLDKRAESLLKVHNKPLGLVAVA